MKQGFVIIANANNLIVTMILSSTEKTSTVDDYKRSVVDVLTLSTQSDQLLSDKELEDYLFVLNDFVSKQAKRPESEMTLQDEESKLTYTDRIYEPSELIHMLKSQGCRIEARVIFS